MRQDIWSLVSDVSCVKLEPLVRKCWMFIREVKNIWLWQKRWKKDEIVVVVAKGAKEDEGREMVAGEEIEDEKDWEVVASQEIHKETTDNTANEIGHDKEKSISFAFAIIGLRLYNRYLCINCNVNRNIIFL